MRRRHRGWPRAVGGRLTLLLQTFCGRAHAGGCRACGRGGVWVVAMRCSSLREYVLGMRCATRRTIAATRGCGCTRARQRDVSWGVGCVCRWRICDARRRQPPSRAACLGYWPEARRAGTAWLWLAARSIRQNTAHRDNSGRLTRARTGCQGATRGGVVGRGTMAGDAITTSTTATTSARSI